VPWVAGGSAPVARLLKVNSPTKITIGGLEPFSAAELALATSGVTGRD